MRPAGAAEVGRVTGRRGKADEDAAEVSRQWQRSPTLGEPVLDRLFEMNRLYLNVLTLDTPSHESLQGTDRGADTAALLDPGVKIALARCPFALFNARFHDATFWTVHTRSTAVHEPIQHFLNFHTPNPNIAAFTELALFYAWHLVQSNSSSARIVLGMAETAVSAFREFPLTGIQRLAARQPMLVTPRWSQHTPFWRGLLHVVRSGPAERVEDMRLLGIQMMASQLAQRAAPD